MFFVIFAALPSPIMEAAFSHLHNGGPVAFGRRPTVVESIMVDGEPANIAKTCGNRYQILADLYILPIPPLAADFTDYTSFH